MSKFPNDKGLLNGLESVKKEKEGPIFSGGASAGGMPPGMGNLFGPEMMAKIAMDPKLRGYMSDPDFMAKLQLLQKDPNQINTLMNDKRIMEVFMAMLGAQGMDVKTADEFEETKQKEPSVVTEKETKKKKRIRT